MSFIKLENEEALEALADMLEPAAIICADSELQDMVRKSKPPLLIAKKIMQLYPKEIIAIMAASELKPVEEYKVSVLGIMKKLLDLLNDKEIQSFFISQAQTAEQTHSGQPMENTEASEQ